MWIFWWSPLSLVAKCLLQRSCLWFSSFPWWQTDKIVITTTVFVWSLLGILFVFTPISFLVGESNLGYFRLSPWQVSHPAPSISVSLCLTFSASPPCPMAAHPTAHQNDNGIDVKCVAFGPLKHITSACLTQPPPQFMALLCPLLCLPLVGWADYNLENSLYMSLWVGWRLCVCWRDVSQLVHCIRVYPDQLVRVQPLKIKVSTCTSAFVNPVSPGEAGLHPFTYQLLWGIIFLSNQGWNKLSNNSTLPFHVSLPIPPSLISLPPSFHSSLSFPHYQGVACDWQMGTNNNFFFRNLRPSSVIGLPADISKPHSPHLSPPLILGLWMRHPEGEKSREREKDIYLREEPQREGGKERTGRSVCACV